MLRTLRQPYLAAGLLLCTLTTGMPAHAAGTPASSTATRAVAIEWHDFSDELFARAKREQRFILLDLEAVWCHWCHVMDKATYRDAKVAALIGRHYIAVKADQDARPDLSRRYDEYGWPATVVFAPDGTEIVKRRGYIDPERMSRLLAAIVKDPSPLNYRDQAGLRGFSRTPLLAPALQKTLNARFVETHDDKLGGLDQEQKFVDRDAVEYALMLGAKGDSRAQKMARQTLDGALALLDPVWGGAYQYSTDRDWQHPHFEKLLSIQADQLLAYALAYQMLGNPAYLDTAKSIQRYVSRFLMSPQGAFYVSQDADLVKGEHSAAYFALDDEGRRKLGIPAVDRHLYAREQGWMIQALVQLYSATLDAQYLQQAITAAEWALAHRGLTGGGFRHDDKDQAGPFLEDTLAMARGMLDLYATTGDRSWLAFTQSAARFVRRSFATPSGAGFASAADRGQTLKPTAQIDENIAAARLFNLLARYTGDADYAADAKRAMRFLVTREVALLRSTNPGILLADTEVTTDPVHLTIVGAKDDRSARALFQSALRMPSGYRRIEWWDRNEGPLPNPDVRYPDLAKAAAFVCTSGACSLPQFDGPQMLALAQRLASETANSKQ